jgi:hypothetical protein
MSALPVLGPWGEKHLLGMSALPVLGVSAKKHLLLDSRIIERTEGVRLALGTVTKDPHNPLFGDDKPWEPYPGNQCTSSLFDKEERIFKSWYNLFVVDEQYEVTPKEKRVFPYKPGKREMGVCYAVSKDGIGWEKPELGLVDYKGSTRNNLVARDTWEVGVFKDPRDPDPARRYKMFFKAKYMAARFSRDGLHWSATVEFPEIQANGDTHNNAFWAPELNRYVGITRLKHPVTKERYVGRTESPDFLKWTKAVEVMRALPDEAPRQTYAMPVFRYANVYLGLVMMFNAGATKMFTTEANAVDCELAWSADTMHWERICLGTPLIPRGPEGSFDGGCIYAAAYPFLHNGQILLYYSGSNGTHDAWREDFLCLARLRPDGFAGMETTSSAPGTVTTRPVRCGGNRLSISADAKGGSVRVALPGVGLSRPISGAVTDHAVSWPSAPALEGREVELRFELRSAKLYSFTFSA